MALRMYKGTLNWNEWKSGDRHEPTHILLSNDEYEELQNENKSLQILIKKQEVKAREDKERTEKIYKEVIEELKEKDNETFERLKNEKGKADQETEYQKGLNRALLEMSKNRANADRKLQPKKDHTGYAVISSAEKTIKYREGNHMKELVVWETAIQSPYSVDFSDEQARKQMEYDLYGKEGSGLIKKLGIEALYFKNIGSLAYEDAYKGKNCLFEKHIRANYKAGYWEFIFSHTKALGIVPKEMRAK